MPITFTFSDPGSATVQAYNTNAMSVLELGASNIAKYSVSLPGNMMLETMVLAAPAVQSHEYQFFVSGHSVLHYIFSSEINPSVQTRIDFAKYLYGFPGGADIQIRTAQLTEASTAAAEPTQITVTWV